MGNLLFEIHQPATSAKAVEAEQLAKERIAHLAPFKSWKAYGDAFRRELRKHGHKTVRATYGDAGNCTICGECGRCPGHHVERKNGG